MAFHDLKGLGEDYLKRNSDKITTVQVFLWWDEIVGPQIAEVTQPVYFQRGVLWVDVKENNWRSELTYHVPTILKKYREKFIQENLNLEIKGIQFKYNPHFKKKRTSRPPSHLTPKSFLPESDPLTQDNIDKRLQIVLNKFQHYAAGKNIPPPLIRKTSPNSINGEEKYSKTTRTDKINRYYSENNLYSEFIHTVDEFQNFDLF